MFWNEMTMNTLIMVYILGLFILILVCLYALIQSKANKLYTFIIIPLALIMASMTWQGIKLLQGMPVYGLPEKEEVEVMWVNDNKPWIYVVLKKDGAPVLYKIDWSEENKKKMKELEKKIGSSLAQGQFETTKSNAGESESLFFIPMMNLSEPQEKRSGNEDDSVTYTTSGNTNPDPVILPVNPDEGRTGAEERERTSNNILRPSLITEFEGVEVETPEVVYGPEENPGP
jgi:hypothetical protein